MIELNVVGVPAPQGSKTAFAFIDKRSGKPRAVVTEGGQGSKGKEKHRTWRAAVADAARGYVAAHPAACLSGATAITIHFRFSPIASDRFRTRHTTKPDLDKLARSVLDALVDGGILVNDSTVWSLKADKLYVYDEPPGCRVLIWDHAGDEASDREDRKESARLAHKNQSTEGAMK
jgi:Holliday junction resolvase RusA-like endonuclease